MEHYYDELHRLRAKTPSTKGGDDRDAAENFCKPWEEEPNDDRRVHTFVYVTSYITFDRTEESKEAYAKTKDFIGELMRSTELSPQKQGLVIALTRMSNCHEVSTNDCVNKFANRVGVSVDNIVPLQSVDNNPEVAGSPDQKFAGLVEDLEDTMADEMFAGR
jgi:hypothetical protein